MKKLGDGLTEALFHLGATDADRIARRTAIVHTRWKEAVVLVYKDAAQLVLDHVNGVVIKKEEGFDTLIIYSDDSLIRSDLDTRQEFLKMKLKVLGENVEVFKILPSKFDMKNRHPFKPRQEDFCQHERATGETSSAQRDVELSGEQKDMIATHAAEVEDERVRRALVEAMAADMQWKNGDIDKNNS